MKKYGLLGYPLSHSFSKRYFTKKFEIENIDATYENYEFDDVNKIIDIVDLDNALFGFNVTIPYKQKILSLLDKLDDEALKIGAVNVVKVIRKGNNKRILKGYNTDVDGFVESIKPLIKEYHHSALVLGTGGASKAVAYGLSKLGVKTTFISRKSKGTNILSYRDLSQKVIEENLIVVNTTPLGTYPNLNEMVDFPFEYVGTRHLFYDLTYNPSETLFLRRAKEKCATIKNGEEMLMLQAEKAWKIWNNESL